MRGSRLIASPAVGVLVLLWTVGALPVAAQEPLGPVTRVASLDTGSISGLVQDEHGAAVAGAIVTAVGATTAFASTDRAGRFELRTLSPGPYLLRAHLNGFVSPRGQLIQVRPSARLSSSIALRRTSEAAPTAPHPVLEAGVAGAGADPSPAAPAAAPPVETPPTTGTAGTTIDDDHGEVAWRLRHARRGVLRDARLPDDIVAGGAEGQPGFFGRTTASSSRMAANVFGGAPLGGQVNLLTTGSFDSPQQLFSTDSFAHGVAFLSLHAAAGDHADWSVRGALTEGDLSSWIVAAEYAVRTPEHHRYDLGFSYSAQRLDVGSLAAPRDGPAGTRNASEVYATDVFTINPSATLTYGARVARYDYLTQPMLLSPRVELTLTAEDHSRLNIVASRRAIAPGAEEFVPPADSPIWLPPQRTFSTLTPEGTLRPEHTDHLAVELERDILGPDTTVVFRAFGQHVTDQLATIFGIDGPGPAAQVGHYFVADAGDVSTLGWSAGARATIAGRVHGSLEYSTARASVTPGSDLAYMILLAPSAVRPSTERIHTVATSFETQVPETATRVLVLYRVSSGLPLAADSAGLDARFDVQVRQSLPFMDFSGAKWEMLVAVRNTFRTASPDASVYDELLVVHPPKRIVGGLTLRF